MSSHSPPHFPPFSPFHPCSPPPFPPVSPRFPPFPPISPRFPPFLATNVALALATYDPCEHAGDCAHGQGLHASLWLWGLPAAPYSSGRRTHPWLCCAAVVHIALGDVRAVRDVAFVQRWAVGYGAWCLCGAQACVLQEQQTSVAKKQQRPAWHEILCFEGTELEEARIQLIELYSGYEYVIGMALHARQDDALGWGGGGGCSWDAFEGKGPQRGAQQRLGRRLEEVAEAVGGGYCRLLAIRGTVAGHRLGALEGGYPPPSQCIPGQDHALGLGGGCHWDVWAGPPPPVQPPRPRPSHPKRQYPGGGHWHATSVSWHGGGGVRVQGPAERAIRTAVKGADGVPDKGRVTRGMCRRMPRGKGAASPFAVTFPRHESQDSGPEGRL